jgi:FkbM family methyltransferase
MSPGLLGLRRSDPLEARRATALNLRWEELWLRLLPHVTRNYAWAPVDGFRMFGSTRHQRYLWRLRRGRVEPFTVQLFRELVRPGMVVVDVGAYLGYYTLLAARGSGSSGQVHAFECNPVNHRFLLHNLRLNGLQTNVVASSSAVTDQPGRLPFFVRSWDLSAGSLWQESHTRRVVEVPATTLDHELDGQSVDVLKMDIEGGEPRALDGMTETISASPNLVMFAECNPNALAASGSSAEELIQRLESLGFEVREIDERARVCQAPTKTLLAQESAEDPDFFVNLFCAKTTGMTATLATG